MSKYALMILMLGSWLVVAARPTSAEDKDDAERELKKLEGTWVMVSGEHDGKAEPAASVKDARLVIQGNRHSVKVGKETFVGTHKLDPSKTPKAIDSTDTEGLFKDQTVKGIYEVTDDTFRVCFAPPEKERPTEFTTKSGTGTILHVWKKQKEKE